MDYIICEFGREVGNATGETDLCFEFGGKVKKELHSVPIQLQIKYTRLDGMKCLRVVTIPRKVTTDRTTAEKNVNVSVVGINSIQQAAKMGLRYEILSP